MIRIFWYISMIFLFAPVMAQVNLDIQLPPRALQKIQESKSAHEKATQYKKYYSKEQKKAEKKLAKAKAIASDSAWIRSQLPDAPDTAQLLTLTDSAMWAEKVLSAYATDDEYRRFSGLMKRDTSLQGVYQSSLTQGTDLATQELSGFLPDDMGTMPEIDVLTGKDQLVALDVSGINPAMAAKPDLATLTPKSGAEKVMEHFREVPPLQMASAQSQLALMKKKYVSLPGLDREDEAVKRSSLQGYPLKHRIYLGGNVSLHASNPVLMDIDLKLGYKLNKMLAVGIGGIFREEFGIKDPLKEFTGDALGYSFFVNYDLMKNFFAIAEWQQIGEKINPAPENGSFQWEQAYYLGLGRSFSLAGRISLTMTLLYDFNHLNNLLHPRPWVVRFGYRIR